MVDRFDRRSAEHQSVLLVDDDSGRFTSHRRRLESRGYHVVRASDASVALTLARQSGPWAIFVAVERQGSERTSFLLALRRDDHTRHIPVTLLPVGHEESLERLGLSRVGREQW